MARTFKAKRLTQLSCGAGANSLVIQIGFHSSMEIFSVFLSAPLKGVLKGILRVLCGECAYLSLKEGREQ
jgi:hypothetical protein